MRRLIRSLVRLWRRAIRLGWEAYALWMRADCVDLSAAFAYHTLQSFFPALLLALAFASRILGHDIELLGRVIGMARTMLPESALPVFEATLARFTRQAFGAGLLGGIFLVLSASNIYLTLQRGADRLWWNRPFGLEQLAWHQLVLRFVALRLKAFTLLVFVGLVIGFDQLISSLRFFGSRNLRLWLLDRLPAPLHGFGSVSSGADVLISLLLSFVATTFFLWLLPSRRVPLSPLLPGALLVSSSVTALNLLLGRTLVALGLRFQAYGVVGGVLVLTFWIWLVGVLVYYGQCLSVVLARGLGTGGPSTPPSDGSMQ